MDNYNNYYYQDDPENDYQDIYDAPEYKKGGGCFLRLICLAVILFIVWWANNFLLFTTKETISSKKIKNDVKIAVLSDLHASECVFAISSETIIKKINKISPDVVCVLGDMHSSSASDEEKDISLRLMRDIAEENYKVFFVLGEHDDRTNGYVAKMEKNGIEVLDTEKEKIRVKDTDITFYGISNAWFSPGFDLNDDFKLDNNSYNILLAHIPMYEYYNKFAADLILCADTHGGIIQVPFLGPAYYNGQVLPEIFGDKNNVYDKGLFKTDSGYMFITSGIGNYPFPARFNNFPEIVEITLKKEN